MSKLYKLSPSDFGYVLEECKHCFYMKVKFGISYSGTFPSMFGRINSLLQNSIMGWNLQDIHPTLPAGIIESQEGFVKSLPLTSAEEFYISGRYDILVRQDDETYILIDFKITPPDEEKIQKKYASQLHAYKYALENPANGKEPIIVSRMGVISVHPEAMNVVDGKIVFTTQPTWHEIPVNMDGFFLLGKQIADLLDGELPKPADDCKLCKYRNYFQSSQTLTEDIPF